MNNEIKVKEIIKESWIAMKPNWGVLMGSVLLYIVIMLIFGFISDNVTERMAGAGGIFAVGTLMLLVSLILQAVFKTGLINMVLNISRFGSTTFSDLFSKASKWFLYMVTHILYSILIFIGLVLLIIPGIYFAIKYGFATFALIDKDLGPIDALKKSAELTKGERWNVLKLWAILLLINIAGAIPLGLGLLATIPLTMVSFATLYKKLDAKTTLGSGTDFSAL